ncbi:YceI family protein [Fulvivirgaceae bacterium BMA10]|uniref:YceI family protein n=1 Tax=Splendidivirga corallicola TaxID=3051826 RepID=A0ABT8KJZ6_9BACT|nr:YceI family protein [Fulvivirgaceae bacterium BMA10]
MIKKSFLILGVATLIFSAFTLKEVELASHESVVTDGTYKVNAESSSVAWLGRKIAYGHNGTVDLAGGSLVFANSVLTSGSFEIDMTTIKNLDLDDAGKNKKLVGHLKSDDFFSVKKFPKATFKITSAKKEKSEHGNYMITGDLTIKGITHPLTFAANVEENGGKVIADAKMTFDRAKYNVKFQSGSFFENLGDKAIYDDIEMTIKLVAEK